MPSRLTVLKPSNANVTEYVPGRKSTTRYCPVASVLTDRTFSIRTGLATSTVTPGSTPPDTSLTTPVIAPCAAAGADMKNVRARIPRATIASRIPSPSVDRQAACGIGAECVRRAQHLEYTTRGNSSELCHASWGKRTRFSQPAAATVRELGQA